MRALLLLAVACGPGVEEEEERSETSPTRTTPEFEVVDELVSATGASIPDPEFDVPGLRLAWQEPDGSELWTANFDPVTGYIEPADGRGELVDVGVVPMWALSNGPEWVHTATGSEVLYSRDEPDDLRYLFRASREAEGWVPAPVDSVPGRMGSLGSQDLDDPAPRVIFVDLNDGWIHWSFLDGTGDMALTDFQAHAPRWIPERVALVWAEAVDGVGQVHRFEQATGAIEVLTDASVELSNPFLWTDPARGREVFFARRADAEGALVALDLFEEVGGQWLAVHTVLPPTELPHVISPEPFVVDGRSFVTFAASATPEPGGEAEIWLASVSPGQEWSRRISQSGGLAADPEPVVTDEGAFVYYSERLGGDKRLRRCLLGLDLP